MKFSEQWLRTWVDPKISTQELAHQLTMAGLEVETIEPVGGNFTEVVIGEVLKVEAHPNARKLKICEVDIGSEQPLTIVCGASNVCPKLRVPTALLGARLPHGIEIKKCTLQGIDSFGMLCSAKDLGLAEQSEGLLELPSDASVGEAVHRYLQLDDFSMELGLTPNRGDCLSIAGIAREVGVLNQCKITPPQQQIPDTVIEDTFEVILKAPADCPHYVGRIIRGINNHAQTPIWLKERLRRCGIRSLGAVVDVTNYVMLELGQPMHAFDLACLKGGIQVRHTQAGEELALLDGQQLEMGEGSLVIADDQGPVALAGIMGGSGSAVQSQTSDIFLESAYFDPTIISGRARDYGLHTDSSHRFERGVAPGDLQINAIERATELLQDIVGGHAGPIIEQTVSAHMPLRKPVPLRASRLHKILGGVDIPAEKITTILNQLGMSLTETEQGWQVRPPDFRFDIALEEDLIEEVARVYGYDRLQAITPHASLAMPFKPEGQISRRQIQQVLVSKGYQEAITYSFVDPKLQHQLDPQHSPIPLANPISADLSVMRTNLWPGLIRAVLYNLHRQQYRIKLFEYGLKYISQGAEIMQQIALGGVVLGDAWPNQWGISSREVEFFDIKADMEIILGLTGYQDEFIFTADEHEALHPGQTARIERNGKHCGWLGALHPVLAEQLSIGRPIFLYELEVDAISQACIPRYQPLSKFPAIRRDISLFFDRDITVQKIRNCIAASAPQSLSQVELFDVYMGEGIDSGRKSVAIALTLQDLSRTLIDKEVNLVIDNIVETLHTELGATLRE